MNPKNRSRVVVIGAAFATSSAGALGADLGIDEHFTASFVTRIIDTPKGPMAVCGNPLPEDGEWIEALNTGSGVADFVLDLPADGSAIGVTGRGPSHAGHVPAPGAATLMILSGAAMVRRRR